MLVFDRSRLRRFATFGLFDGAFSHFWFVLLDIVITGKEMGDVVKRIALDQLVFTPSWAAWFICCISLLEGVCVCV